MKKSIKWSTVTLKKSTFAFLTMMLFMSFTALAQWKNPTDDWKTIGPPKGTLLIIGGSAVPSIYKDFIKLVGNPNDLIVFIPTAGDVVDATNNAYTSLVEAGAKNIIVLHTKDQAEANSEEFVEPVRKAKGVFIGGGFQNRLAKAYLHTLTHKAMFDVLARGGVVAGSSAGASIQGSFLYGGGADQKVGFGFVKESAIGQHYVRRNRMGGVAKILKDDPKLIGIGIDEATGIVVKGNEFEVIGDSKVAMYDAQAANFNTPKPQLYVFPGDKYNLFSRKIIHEAIPSPTDLWPDADKKWKDPAANWKTVGPPAGKLIVYGEGKTQEEMLKHFLTTSDAGKSSIVVISTGNADKKAENEKVVTALRNMGAKNITGLHTFNTNQANSLSFVKAVNAAAAVWICDSEKWQLAETYLNTLLHKELFDVLKRNGTIGAMGGGAAMLASNLSAQPYRWNKGFALMRQTIIFDEPLAGKAIKAMRETLAKNQMVSAIGLEKGTVLIIEKDQVTVSGDGNSNFYNSSATNPIILSSGKQYPLNR